MTRHFFSVALALSCVWGTPSVSCAAESVQKIARLGFVGSHKPSTAPRGVGAFWERLRELGWVKGENLVIEERWADGRMDRLPALMAEVLEHKVDVLVTHTTPGAIA